jgi:drug/metabolite transporter (DMT)-like permease
MSQVTVQQTRKRIKVQQPFAFLTLVIGVVLVVMGSQSGQELTNNLTMGNGVLTALAGVVWMGGLRVAKWWFHD